MRTLSLNLAGSIGSATLLTDGHPAVTTELAIENEPLRQSGRLIAAVIGLAETAIVELDLLCGVSGPGSWTGLRVTAATLNTMSLVAGIPVVGVSLIEVLAEYARGIGPDVLGVIQVGLRQACVVELGGDEGGEPDLALIRTSELPAVMAGRRALIEGDGDLIRSLGESAPDAEVIDSRRFAPISVTAALIAVAKWNADPTAFTDQLRPIYAGSPVTASTQRTAS